MTTPVTDPHDEWYQCEEEDPDDDTEQDDVE